MAMSKIFCGVGTKDFTANLRDGLPQDLMTGIVKGQRSQLARHSRDPSNMVNVLSDDVGFCFGSQVDEASVKNVIESRRTRLEALIALLETAAV
jgi:hypothetical protein